jgi:chemotaxis protein histidine kinase CheA
VNCVVHPWRCGWFPQALLFNRFKRVVRDLGSELGKHIDFKVEGSETELDKSLVESLYEPLLHLVRNAVDHGSGTPGAEGGLRASAVMAA